jgi:hypothetical protein
MYSKHQQGEDISTMVYWQVDAINKMLKGLEVNVGVGKVRDKYEDWDKI